MTEVYNLAFVGIGEFLIPVNSGVESEAFHGRIGACEVVLDNLIYKVGAVYLVVFFVHGGILMVFGHTSEYVVGKEDAERAFAHVLVEILADVRVHHRRATFVAVGVVVYTRARSGVLNRGEVHHPGSNIGFGEVVLCVWLRLGLRPLHERACLGYLLVVEHVVASFRKVLHMEIGGEDAVGCVVDLAGVLGIEFGCPVGHIAGLGEVDEVDAVAAKNYDFASAFAYGEVRAVFNHLGVNVALVEDVVHH